jgi:hypothetical protein
MERRSAADYETRLIPDALNKRDGVGGYVEALPKYLPHFLHPLLNLKPFPTRFCDILEDAALCRKVFARFGFPFLRSANPNSA